MAYALSLGAFRGGPIFPSIMLGGALGVLIAPLPGLGLAGGMAVGMAAFASAGMKMPLSAVALTVLLFGPNASEVFPEVAIAAVTAYALRIAVDKRRAVAPEAGCGWGCRCRGEPRGTCGDRQQLECRTSLLRERC